MSTQGRYQWGRCVHLESPSPEPRDPFKECGQGGPAVPAKAHSVLPLSLQLGLGWRARGLAEAPALIQSERRVPGWWFSPGRCYFHPAPVTAFLVLVSCPFREEGLRVIQHLIRRKWLALRGDRVTQCPWTSSGVVGAHREKVTHFHIPSHVDSWVGGFWRRVPIKVFSGLSIS